MFRLKRRNGACQRNVFRTSGGWFGNMEGRRGMDRALWLSDCPKSVLNWLRRYFLPLKRENGQNGQNNGHERIGAGSRFVCGIKWGSVLLAVNSVMPYKDGK